MIQDIAPHQYRNEYAPGHPGDKSAILFYNGRKIMLKKEENHIVFPSYREIMKCKDEDFSQMEYIYLFSIDRQDFYLGKNTFFEDVPGYAWEDIQKCFAEISGLCGCYRMAALQMV